MPFNNNERTFLIGDESKILGKMLVIPKSKKKNEDMKHDKRRIEIQV